MIISINFFFLYKLLPSLQEICQFSKVFPLNSLLKPFFFYLICDNIFEYTKIKIYLKFYFFSPNLMILIIKFLINIIIFNKIYYFFKKKLR
jgi:hypothetical protein